MTGFRITADTLPTAASPAPSVWAAKPLEPTANPAASAAKPADPAAATAVIASPVVAAHPDPFAADAASGADPSESFPLARCGTADSLSGRTTAVSAPFRDVAPERIFGTASISVPPPASVGAGAPSLTDNPVFQGFVLLLAAAYALLLSRNLGDVRQLLSRISRDRATGQRLSEDPGRSGFFRFLNTATVIGMLFMGVVVVKYGDSLVPRQLLELLPHGAVLMLSLLATTVCSLLVLYQSAAVRLAGAVTLSQGLVSQLQLLKRTYFSLAVVIASPALLLFALCPRGTGEMWFVVIAIELAVTAILYLKESLHLFLSKKISILHWFLYLCIVEIFPITLLCLLAVR